MRKKKVSYVILIKFIVQFLHFFCSLTNLFGSRSIDVPIYRLLTSEIQLYDFTMLPWSWR